MLGGVQVEHELGQRPVQACELPTQHHKPGFRNLGAIGKTHPRKMLTERHVIPDLKIEFGGRAHSPHFDVVVLVLAHRHALVREIGHPCEQPVERRLHVGERGLILFEGVSEPGHGLEDRRHGFTCGLGLAYLFGFGVALGLQFLSAGLKRLAAGLEIGNGFGIEHEAPGRKPFGHGLDIATQTLWVKHVAFLENTACRRGPQTLIAR